MPNYDHVHADAITKLIDESQEIKSNDNIHAKEDIHSSKEVLGPSVNISESALFDAPTDRTPTIGGRKPQPKRAGVRFYVV